MDPLESNYVHGRSVENDSLRTPSGQSIVSQQDGRAAAATFSRDWSDADIVGCGLDCRSGEVFFTLNGNVLALPFRLGPDFLLAGQESQGAVESQEEGVSHIWPAFSAASPVKVRLRVGGRLKFDGFAEVLESLNKCS